MLRVELNDIQGNVWVGRASGLAARNLYDVDNWDSDPEELVLIIPDHVYTISSSFFIGMFGPSFTTLGYEGFGRKYQFVAHPMLKNVLQMYVSTARYR